jgi:hypothetical protein
MTGLLLLFVLGIWLTFVIWLTPKLTKAMQPGSVKKIAQFLLFLILLVAPIADEIIGGFQFRALCSEGAVVKVDEEKARGKTVKLRSDEDSYVQSSFVPIRIQNWIYEDTKNRDVVISYQVYHATGGWLIRALGISETTSPLTFSSYCAPSNQMSIFKKLNITKVN